MSTTLFAVARNMKYRSRPTKIRGRVFLYASMGPGDESYWKRLKRRPGDLPKEVIVGSVEIVDCKKFEENDYRYVFKNPRRYKKYLTTENRPQSLFFFPFNQKKA